MFSDDVDPMAMADPEDSAEMDAQEAPAPTAADSDSPPETPSPQGAESAAPEIQAEDQPADTPSGEAAPSEPEPAEQPAGGAAPEMEPEPVESMLAEEETAEPEPIEEPAEDEPLESILTEEAEEQEPIGEPVKAAAPEMEPEPDEPVVSVMTAEEVDDGRHWYVVHCYSGYENKVRHNLEQRIESMNMKDFIFDVVVPTEEEIEVKEGKRRTIERRVFPGYILVNMIMNEESWYVVRNTPGVTSFVGMGNDPTPLRPEEVSQIIKRMEADAPRVKVTFKQGERVRIVDGPFNDFRGTVDEIDMERAKVRVMVNFFGRETPVELDFLQVEKA